MEPFILQNGMRVSIFQNNWGVISKPNEFQVLVDWNGITTFPHILTKENIEDREFLQKYFENEYDKQKSFR